jgi:hypothetical protein
VRYATASGACVSSAAMPFFTVSCHTTSPAAAGVAPVSAPARPTVGAGSGSFAHRTPGALARTSHVSRRSVRSTPSAPVTSHVRTRCALPSASRVTSTRAVVASFALVPRTVVNPRRS